MATTRPKTSPRPRNQDSCQSLLLYSIAAETHHFSYSSHQPPRIVLLTLGKSTGVSRATMDAIFPNVHPRALDPPMSGESLLRTLREWSIPSFSAEEMDKLISNALHDIDLFENCIQQLRGRQAALKRDVTRYRSLHSPIRKLPPEILRRIFSYACALDPTIEYPYRSTAFRISSVCSRWREIALQSPGLWASLNVLLSARSLIPVRLAVARSQNHPLSLRLSGTWGEDNACRDLFYFLMAQSERWLYVDFSEASPDAVDMLEDLSFTPLLETITFAARDGTSIFDPVRPAPRLHTVRFRNEEAPVESFNTFPWGTIRHLDMDYDGKLTPVSLFKVLEAGTALQSLVYRGEATRRIEGFDESPYSMFRFDDLGQYVNNLTTFAICLGDSQGFYDLLNDVMVWLTLPSLTNLTIRHEETVYDRTKYGFTVGGEWPRDVIHGFLDRSGCTLTSLTLEGMPLVEMDVIALLKVTPSLQSFTLREMWASDLDMSAGLAKPPPRTAFKTVTQALLKRLEAPIFASDAFSNQSPLLPKLRCLKLGVTHLFDADEVFVTMVRSRWDRPGGVGCTSMGATEWLREVVLCIVYRDVMEEVYQPLKRLDTEGMMVSVFENARRVI
ncbi:hypothetical protein PQX77_011286 [Marasmius sp. AFHP31]|nr:hypothetical protein PQX77_011286 [Marasmius sp. AFHP31]